MARLTLDPDQAALVRELAEQDAEQYADATDAAEVRMREDATHLAATLDAGSLTVEVRSPGDFAGMVWHGAENALHEAHEGEGTPGYRDTLRRLAALVGVLMAVDEASGMVAA